MIRPFRCLTKNLTKRKLDQLVKTTYNGKIQTGELNLFLNCCILIPTELVRCIEVLCFTDEFLHWKIENP